MAFNGNGVFLRLYSWVNDALAGVKIRADRMDNEMDGMATGLSNCITKDGQTTITGNLPMSGFKHLGVGKATALTQYASAEQVIGNELKYYTATGTDSYAIAPNPSIGSYVAGQSFYVKFTNANTGAATLNVSAIGAKAMTKSVDTALVSGDIAAGSIKEVVYDGTRFQVKDIADTIADGSITPANLADAGFGAFDVVSGVAALNDNSIETDDVTDLAITGGKLATTVQNSILNDFVSGVIETPADQDYRLLVNVPYGFTISSITTRSVSGTCTATFKINTTARGGTANSVSSTEDSQAHATANTLVSGDDLVVTISSNADCLGLSFTVKFARAF